jgi:purine-binding chemotaxis protein CheW
MADAAAAAEPPRQFLTFRLDQRLYALPADEVAEVIRLPAVARVPQAPAGLMGLANLRGEVLPVASLRGLLGDAAPRSADKSADTRAIVLGGGAAVALAVDRVEALVSIAPDAIDAAELAAEGAERLDGVFETTAGVARILDLKAMLAQAFVARPRASRSGSVGKAATPGTQSAANEGRRLVIFEVAGQEFAIPLEAVREITPASADLAAAPGADSVVLGVSAYRGGLLPLMSLRGLLGLSAPGSSEGRASVIVTLIGGVLVGLVADRMRAVVSADPTLIDPTPPVLAARIGGEAKVSAMYRADGGRRLVSIIEPEQLFREEIMQRLGDADRAAAPGGAFASDAGNAAEAGAQSLFLVFRLEGDEFALPIAAVDEVALAPSQITRLPKMPAFLEGVANLRGEVLPVVDQRRRFGMGAAADRTRRRMIVIRSERHRAGLIVDDVSEVLRSADDALQPPPDLNGETNRLVTGVINLEDAGRIVMVLDPAELLSRVERGLLDAFAGELSDPGAGPAA